MAGKQCAICKKSIMGVSMTLNGKMLCIDCYNEQINILQQLDAEKTILFNYIKGIFKCDELPYNVVYDIDTFISKGKKVSGIRATVWYYYEILGNRPSFSDFKYFSNIIEDNYDKTRDYVMKMRELKEKNMKVDLNVPAQNVKIVKQSDEETRLKPKYKMEDL